MGRTSKYSPSGTPAEASNRGCSEIAQGEAVLRDIGDALGLAKLLCVRGAVEAQHGAHDAARAALDEAVAIAATLGAQAQSELGQSIEALRARLA